MRSALKTTSALVFAIVAVTTAACSGGGDDASEGGGEAVSASHDVFQCTLSSGSLIAGDDFKLTMGDGTATVESSDLGKHSGKIQKNAPSVPSSSDRYLISGLADDGVTGIIIPKNIRTDTRAMVHVEATTDDKKKETIDFLCHPDDSSSAPSSGRGGGGSSGVKSKLELSCKLAANADESFGDTMDITLTPDDKLSVKSSEVSGDGPFDKAFKPHTNTSFVRYLVDGLFDEASTDVLVEKPILTGKGGRIKVEASGETFLSSTFNCTPKSN